MLELCIAASPEPSGQQAAAAVALLQRGDAAAAQRIHRQALDAGPRHASSWSNLAALAVGLGDAAVARSHAKRALSLDPRSADAWVNFGVASWHAGVRREAAQATHHALQLSPGMETAALNLALMFRAAQEPQRARAALEDALARNGGSVRLHQVNAGLCRLAGDAEATRRHASAALAILLPTLLPAKLPEDGSEPAADVAQAHLLAAMTDACDRLQHAGIAHVLIGGVVLGIAREGDPFVGDKDIDIALDDGVDRDAVAAAFAAGFTPVRVPAAHASDARRWCMGYTHEVTGIGIDLFFMQRGDTTIRQGLGWPDQLLYDYPSFVPGMLAWRGRDWPVPAPLEAYLASNYGDDWRSPWREVGDGRRFDKRWFDTQVSCPGLVTESIPRAVNLVLLRLIASLRQGQWAKALALCDQVLVREFIGEVEAVRRHLLGAGIQ